MRRVCRPSPPCSTWVFAAPHDARPRLVLCVCVCCDPAAPPCVSTRAALALARFPACACPCPACLRTEGRPEHTACMARTRRETKADAVGQAGPSTEQGRTRAAGTGGGGPSKEAMGQAEKRGRALRNFCRMHAHSKFHASLPFVFAFSLLLPFQRALGRVSTASLRSSGPCRSFQAYKPSNRQVGRQSPVLAGFQPGVEPGY